MYHGHLEGNMPHTLTANHLLGHLYAASVARNPTILIAFVLTTMAFVIFYRTKDTLTVKPITLGLERAVTYRFVLCDFPIRVLQNLLRRCQ